MKTALIVDDSRLARAVLARVLTEHGINSDEVDSAEGALDYLKERRPDVVFLDHNMPGMDGLEALEAIKANPVTATIPVMMYTSEEGQLYVGQARALGAIGVLPKSLQPVEVVNVLRRLHLIGDERREHADTERSSSSHADDTRRMRVLIEGLFYEQANALRDEIRKEMKRAASLFTPPEAPPEPPKSGIRWGQSVFALLLVLLTVSSGLLVLRANAVLEGAERHSNALAETAAAFEREARQATAAAGQRVATRNDDLLDVLEWAANRDNEFDFGDAPLDDRRAEALTALIGYLERLDFRGQVVLDVHVGRFCMNYDREGRLALAPPEQPASACEQVGAPDSDEVILAGRESLAFANVVASAAREGRVQVETMTSGTTRPAVAYPASVYDVSAGEWNAAAAANQRVEVRLLPEGELTPPPALTARTARP